MAVLNSFSPTTVISSDKVNQNFTGLANGSLLDGAFPITGTIGTGVSRVLIQSGTAAVPSGNVTSGTVGSGSVTFPIAYSGTPIVVLTGLGGDVNAQKCAWTVTSTSSTGFVANCFNQSGILIAAPGAQWIAIGPP